MSSHAKIRSVSRGASEGEIIETIKTSVWQKAELNKLSCFKDFVFENTWNNKFYKVKQIKPIFIEEENQIIVITVYVYYF
ncbi:MAG: hypothetical protein AB1472_04115 [Candidatus Omnitrophota bacterium]